MKNKRNFIYFILALLLPMLYHGLNKLWYYLILDLDAIDLLPNFLRTHILTNAMSLDAIFCMLMIILVLPFYFKFKKEDKEQMPAEYVLPITAKGVLICIVIAFGLAGVSAIYQLILRQFFMGVSSVAESVKSFDQTFQSSTTIVAYLWSFLSVAILGPIVEELIFRGVLFSGINRYVSGFWTVIITAVYFGLWHSNPMQVLYTILLGLGFGFAYATTRNIWFPMLIHLVNNMISQLPPSLENNENFVLMMIILRFVAIIPMLIILYKMIKKNKPALNWYNKGSIQ